MKIIGIEPWSSAGPGWANSGVKVILETDDGRIIRRDVYQSDFVSEAEYLAYSVALRVWPTLQKMAERAK